MPQRHVPSTIQIAKHVSRAEPDVTNRHIQARRRVQFTRLVRIEETNAGVSARRTNLRQINPPNPRLTKEGEGRISTHAKHYGV